MTTAPNIPIAVVDLLPKLDGLLLNLLKSLTPQEWDKPTIAKLWNVKDIVAHLLDGNIRILSIFRDDYYGEKAVVNSHEELIGFLNQLNADWVRAMKRASPQMLIALHEATGPLFCDYFKTLNPFDKSVLAVAWAGETESKNWMEIAREYTEKWLHQQQIRDAIDKPGLMTQELYYPFINISMFALPHTFRKITAENGTTIKITVPTDIGGTWVLARIHNNWELQEPDAPNPTSELIIDPNLTWKLFSKSLGPEQVKDKVIIKGNQALGEKALTMVSVMA